MARRSGAAVIVATLVSLPHPPATISCWSRWAVRHRAAGDYRDPRLYRRLARIHARPDEGSHLLALQFDDKATWYLIALAVLGAWSCDVALGRTAAWIAIALEAISEDEMPRPRPAST